MNTLRGLRAGIIVVCLMGAVIGGLTLWMSRSAFPLPTKHSLVAQQATNLSADFSRCPQSEDAVLVARFDLQGFFWLFAFSPETQWFVFVQYSLTDHSTPVRAFVGRGNDDVIRIQRVIEAPARVFTSPCILLFPEQA